MMYQPRLLSKEHELPVGEWEANPLIEAPVRPPKRRRVIFPVPVVGVHFEMTLARKLIWKANGNFFAATISGYHGSVNEISTSIAAPTCAISFIGPMLIRTVPRGAVPICS